MVDSIDSNVTGLAYAEEESFKTLPVTPVWYALEPNSYSDLGGEVTMVARTPINPSRQRKKGVITDLDASGGFNHDVTLQNMIRPLQGFFFADARQKASTAPLNGTVVALTGVDGTGEEYQAASGLDVFAAGDIVKASGFTNAANNGLKTVASADATGVTVNEDLVTETPPAAAKLEKVGVTAGSGDLDVVVSADVCTITSTVLDFTGLGLIVGEWIFIGGDSASLRFASNSPGYARVKSIAANSLVLEETTWAPANETGTGLTVQLFFGTVIKNENTVDLIKRRTYQLERTLGQDANGTMSEYLVGAVPNEFQLNIPQAEMLKADLSFVTGDNEQRDGATGVKSGTRVAATIEDGLNTSSDVYRIRMYIVDPATLNPTALFGFLTEANININNNVSPNKAVSVLGAFEMTAGDFEVGGSIDAYFSDVAAVAAVRNNADVGLNIIFAQNNGGFVYDIPLLALGGGRVNVEKDQPIKIPLESSAAENENGYTLLTTFFPYVPTVGMPS